MAPQYRSKRVLVTRSEGRNASLVQGLAAAGLQPVVCPLLAFEATGAPLPSTWDILVFTSATAVEFWTGPLKGFIAAVGPRTAERLPRVDLLPKQALAAALAEALGDLRGKRVCYPRAEVVAPSFAEALRAAGAEVESVPVYRTILPPDAALPEHDGVLLASGSAARNYTRLGGRDAAVVIGPSTHREALRCGLEVVAVADPHTAEGLVAAATSAWPPGPS